MASATTEPKDERYLKHCTYTLPSTCTNDGEHAAWYVQRRV
jgi:hypothetical protein